MVGGAVQHGDTAPGEGVVPIEGGADRRIFIVGHGDAGGGTDIFKDGLFRWFAHYNDERPHQELGYATPREVYRFPESHGATPPKWELK